MSGNGAGSERAPAMRSSWRRRSRRPAATRLSSRSRRVPNSCRIPTCAGAVDLPLHTYASPREFALRTVGISNVLRPLVERLRATPPDVAIVTMIGYWDIFLARHLRQMGVPLVVVVHDAEVHPGDRFHLANQLQRHLTRKADGVTTLTDYVAKKVQAQLSLDGKVAATIPLCVFDFADLDLPPPRLPKPTAERPLRLLWLDGLSATRGSSFSLAP